MVKRIDDERPKQYTALCDYFNLGPGRSLRQLFLKYQERSNPPCKTYNTLLKWSKENDWDNRILQALEEEQSKIEEAHFEERLKNSRRRYEILDDMFDVANNLDLDTDMVSIAQYTRLQKTILDAIDNVFNLASPDKIAFTDPTGKQKYNEGDINELMKLADAASNRPD